MGLAPKPPSDLLVEISAVDVRVLENPGATPKTSSTALRPLPRHDMLAS